MTEKTIYVANDGKEFEDYRDCEDYEIQLKREKIAQFSPITKILDREYFNITNKLHIIPTDDIYYIYVDNMEDKNKITKLFEEDYCDNPFEYFDDDVFGWFYWNDNDSWVSLNQEYERLNTLKSCMEEGAKR